MWLVEIDIDYSEDKTSSCDRSDEEAMKMSAVIEKIVGDADDAFIGLGTRHLGWMVNNRERARQLKAKIERIIKGNKWCKKDAVSPNIGDSIFIFPITKTEE